MIQQIQNLKRKNSKYCQLVLSVATLAYQPLHLTELAIISGLPTAISAYANRVREVVTLCGSFLTVRESVVYLIHQSVKDYLSTRRSYIFPSGHSEAHYAMFTRSVRALSGKILRRNMYGLPYLGVMINDVKVPEKDPLAVIRYSCVHWARHFCDAGPGNSGFETDNLEMVNRFIRGFFLYWLEAVALLRSMSESIVSIRQLESFLKVSILNFTLSLY